MIKFLIAQFIFIQTGFCTFYDCSWNNRYTANADVFNCHKFTGAVSQTNFKYLKNKQVRVTNLKNKKTVIVKINDVCPNESILVDLSQGAFESIESLSTGKIKVEMTELKHPPIKFMSSFGITERQI